MIVRVAIDNVTPIWEQVEPLVVAGLRGAPTHDAEDVRRMLMAQMCHLWVQWNEPTVEAAVVSEFAVYPKGIWLRAWLAGARHDADMDRLGFRSMLSDWAKTQNCRGLEVNGRHGWLRCSPNAKVEGLFMRETWR